MMFEPPEQMGRDELIQALERARHELAAHQEGARAQTEQLLESQTLLEESRNRYAELYDSVPVGYVSLDRGGVIEGVNLTGAELLGVPQYHLTGQPLRNFVDPPDRRTLLEHMRRCRSEGGSVVGEVTLVSRQGDPLPVQMITHPARGEGRTPIQFRTVLIDQTERRRAEAALRQRESELREANEALRHRTEEAEAHSAQLRSLAAELTQAEQRERRRLAQLLHEHLQQLLVSVKMQLSMYTRRRDWVDEVGMERITDLLDEAIDDARSLSHELSPQVLYHGGLAAALRWLAPREKERYGVTVHLEADAAAEPADEYVRLFLFEAVRELVLNAVKHAGVDEVRVTLERCNGELSLRVADEGPGFDPKQVQSEEEPKYLGLFGIRERLEAMGGHMTIYSAPGRGTTVTLLTPLRETVAEQSPMTPDSPARGRRPDRPRRTEIHVLLAEDHDVVRDALTNMLDQQPDLRVVAEAADGQRAIEQARRHRPDVILMDVSMPGVDGIEATRRVAAELPEIRVIGLSTHDDPSVAQAMYDAGACNYLTKGSSTETLPQHCRLQRGEGACPRSW